MTCTLSSVRRENKERALSLYQAGRLNEARHHFPKGVDVTHQMARKLIKVRLRLSCRRIWPLPPPLLDPTITRKSPSPLDDGKIHVLKALQASGVRYLIAPYEADAQLAYLSLKGLVDVVITEDSDSLTYGCRKVGGYFSRCDA